MNTELITQLIILATAFVGLYKAATFRGRPAKETEATTGRKSPLSDLWDLVGVLLFMLAFPAFLWVYMMIMLNMPSSVASSESSAFASIPDDASELEMQLIAAANVPSEHLRGEALRVVVHSAVVQNDYRIAISAATAIPSEHIKGEELQKIVETLRAKMTETRTATPSPRP